VKEQTMGNARIPKRADKMAEEWGKDSRGRRVEMALYRHYRPGQTTPVFWIVQYRRTPDGQIEDGTRTTRQYSGPRGRVNARFPWQQSANLLRRSRGVTDPQPAPDALAAP
jgi:hypothetical protein